MSTQTPQKYKVAIHCLVYNHEPYLRDCFEGFVMQQTDFPFVAIVHDDASTDRSADIIREYAAKYPDIIHPIYETENQYSKKDGSLTKIMNAVLSATGAKYIAMCEGDDYWADPHKLQKQVEYLEQHPDCVITSHRFVKLYMSDGHKEEYDYSHIFRGKEPGMCFHIEQIYEDWYLQTLCVVYRADAIDTNRWLRYKYHHDNVLFLEIMRNGGYGYIFNECLGVYRIHDTGVYSGLRKEQRLKEAVEKYGYIFREYPANFTRVKLMYQYVNLLQYWRRNVPWYKRLFWWQWYQYHCQMFFIRYQSIAKFLKVQYKRFRRSI